MKKICLYVSLVFFSLCWHSLLSEPIITVSEKNIKIPNHVKYIPASDPVNTKAVDAIKKLCSATQYHESEVPNVIMVGPRLWSAIKDIKPISDKPSIIAHIRVPIDNEIKNLEAGVIRFKERVYNLLYAFKNIIRDSKKVIIRKADENELSYYWMIIAYDIEEPFYVIELDDSKYLIDFDDKSQFFYIEDVSGI